MALFGLFVGKAGVCQAQLCSRIARDKLDGDYGLDTSRCVRYPGQLHEPVGFELEEAAVANDERASPEEAHEIQDDLTGHVAEERNRRDEPDAREVPGGGERSRRGNDELEPRRDAEIPNDHHEEEPGIARVFDDAQKEVGDVFHLSA